MPPYQPEVAFDLSDMHLVAAHGEIWGAQSDPTPASLYRFGPDRSQSFSGHDFDIVQCASDLAAGADERLLILECDGTLAAIEPGQSVITSVQRLGRLIDLPTGPEFGDTERLVADDQATVVASDLRDRSDVGERMRATVARSVPGDEARLLLEVENATTLALGREVILVVLERGDRRRDAIVLELDPGADTAAAGRGRNPLDTGLSGARPAG